MTIISCKNGELAFGPGLPSMVVLDYLRAYKVTNNGVEDRQVIDCLKQGDFRLLIERAQKGADLLDCKIVDLLVDHIEIDTAAVLPELAMAIHEATGQALSLDSRNPEAIRRTLRVYPHKPILNSIPYEQEHIRNLMPLVAEYHTAAILMLTDETGIPETIDGRLRVAEKLIRAALGYGIPLEDLIIDAAVVAPSTVENAMTTTLETMKAVRKEFGCSTLLGVTNACFGMPAQGLLIETYIMAALAAGLDLFLASYEDPVVPLLYSSQMAMDFLTGRDLYGKRFLNAYRKNPERFKNLKEA